MPDPMMNLRDLAAKAAAANLRREVTGFAADCLMRPVGARMSVVGCPEPNRARLTGRDQALIFQTTQDAEGMDSTLVTWLPTSPISAPRACMASLAAAVQRGSSIWREGRLVRGLAARGRQVHFGLEAVRLRRSKWSHFEVT